MSQLVDVYHLVNTLAIFRRYTSILWSGSVFFICLNSANYLLPTEQNFGQLLRS